MDNVPIAAVLKRQDEIAKWLKEEHPEIADIYIQQCTPQKRIVLDYKIEDRFRVSMDTAINALRKALFETGEEPGLIPPELVEQVRKEHEEQRAEQMRGTHWNLENLAAEERSRRARHAGRFGGRASAQANGYHNWFEKDPLEVGSPLRYLFELKYAHGRIPATEAAAHLSAERGEVYTARDVTFIVNRHRKHYQQFVEEKRRSAWRSSLALDNHRKRGNHVWVLPDGAPTEELVTLDLLIREHGRDDALLLQEMDRIYKHEHKSGSLSYALKQLSKMKA